VPVSRPAVVGINVTLMVQLPPAATLAPQVLLGARKSALGVMVEMVIVALVLLVSVTA
jgi:hypothetical protein